MTLPEVLNETLRTFSRKGGRLLGAGIAFYSLLSAAPLLYIALLVAGAFTGEAAAREGLRDDLGFWLGASGADTVMDLVARVKRPEGVTQVAAAVVLVYASTRLFSGLKRALNHILDAPPPESTGMKGRVRRQVEKRLLAFGLVLLVGVVLIGAVAARALLGARLPVGWEVAHAIGSLATTGALFSLLFWALPDRKIPWVRALEGGYATAILFAVGTTLVSAYVGHKSVMQTYGQAGSLVLLLLWVHYSAQIFFLGASFTAVRMSQAAGFTGVTAP